MGSTLRRTSPARKCKAKNLPRATDEKIALELVSPNPIRKTFEKGSRLTPANHYHTRSKPAQNVIVVNMDRTPGKLIPKKNLPCLKRDFFQPSSDAITHIHAALSGEYRTMGNIPSSIKRNRTMALLEEKEPSVFDSNTVSDILMGFVGTLARHAAILPDENAHVILDKNHHFTPKVKSGLTKRLGLASRSACSAEALEKLGKEFSGWAVASPAAKNKFGIIQDDRGRICVVPRSSRNVPDSFAKRKGIR